MGLFLELKAPLGSLLHNLQWMLPHTAGAKFRRANPVSVWLKSAQSENKEWMIEKPQNSESLSCLPLKKSRDAAPSAHRKGIQAHSGRTPGEEKRSFWFGSLSLSDDDLTCDEAIRTPRRQLCSRVGGVRGSCIRVTWIGQNFILHFLQRSLNVASL